MLGSYQGDRALVGLWKFHTGVLFSSSLANSRRFQSLFWWTLLYKMARLENQRGDDTGGDHDVINKIFLLLSSACDSQDSSLTWDSFWPTFFIGLLNRPCTLCHRLISCLQLSVTECFKKHFQETRKCFQLYQEKSQCYNVALWFLAKHSQAMVMLVLSVDVILHVSVNWHVCTWTRTTCHPIPFSPLRVVGLAPHRNRHTLWHTITETFSAADLEFEHL